MEKQYTGRELATEFSVHPNFIGKLKANGTITPVGKRGKADLYDEEQKEKVTKAVALAAEKSAAKKSTTTNNGAGGTSKNDMQSKLQETLIENASLRTANEEKDKLIEKLENDKQSVEKRYEEKDALAEKRYEDLREVNKDYKTLEHLRSKESKEFRDVILLLADQTKENIKSPFGRDDNVIHVNPSEPVFEDVKTETSHENDNADVNVAAVGGKSKAGGMVAVFVMMLIIFGAVGAYAVHSGLISFNSTSNQLSAINPASGN